MVVPMIVEANGTQLWFDVDGAQLRVDGAALREYPTVVLVHGGPGGWDHSYFKPWFTALTDVAQVVYLDLRDHGRSGRSDPDRWSFEQCADDVRAFCDAVGISRPVVLGHSMGGMVAMLYATRHPGHPRGLVLQSTLARFDLGRLVEGFRQVAGDRVADLARRDYAGDPVTDAEWASVFGAFGPHLPDERALARRIRNPAVGEPGMARMRAFDAVADLHRVECPTLVSVGERDPVTPVAAAREIHDALPAHLRRLDVIDGAGHFPWLDTPDRYWAVLRDFVEDVARPDGADI